MSFKKDYDLLHLKKDFNTCPEFASGAPRILHNVVFNVSTVQMIKIDADL